MRSYPIVTALAEGYPGNVSAGRLVTRSCLLLASLLLCACVAPSGETSQQAVSDHPGIPRCNVKGCCEGHGEVAYLQPDKYIMCTDGEVSRICDCH